MQNRKPLQRYGQNVVYEVKLCVTVLSLIDFCK